LGLKSQTSDAFWQNPKKTGMTHVVVALGINVLIKLVVFARPGKDRF